MFGVILNVFCRLTGATRFPVMQESESFPETVACYLLIMDHAGCSLCIRVDNAGVIT